MSASDEATLTRIVRAESKLCGLGDREAARLAQRINYWLSHGVPLPTQELTTDEVARTVDAILGVHHDADPRVEQYAAERTKLATAIHKRVNSSSIARTVPYLVGDADRAVTAVIAEGWTPPAGYVEPDSRHVTSS
jgi:hypothetical protein